MFLPQLWPWLGQLFWSLTALLQIGFGVKDSKLARHLGWQTDDSEAASDVVNDDATDDAATIVAAIVGASTEAPSTAAVVVEEEMSVEAFETRVQKATAPTKSSPAIGECGEKMTRIEAIWRNCNSDTKCQGGGGRCGGGSRRRSPRGARGEG